MLRALLFLLLTQLAIANSAFAQTQDYAVDRAYFEDTTNTLSLAKVKEKPFTHFSGMLSKGYSRSAFWVRLKIAPAQNGASAVKSLVLKIQPTYLDEIQLYDPAEPQRLNRIVGDRYPYANNERKSLTYDFVIPSASEPRYVWLRLKTTSTNLMQISVVQEHDALKLDQWLEIVSTAIFSALVIFLIWAFLHWWMTRERLIGIFLVRQLLGVLFFAAYVGYFRILFAGLISPELLDLTLSFFVLSSTAAAFWFHREFFKDYLIHPWLQAIFTCILYLFPVELMLYAAGLLSTALNINMMVVMVVPLMMLGISIFAIPWARLQDSVSVLPRRYLILAHVVYFVLTTLTTLSSLGFASASIFSPHAVLMHAFVTAVVLVAMILYRAKRMEEKRISDVAVAEQNALNERAKREEQVRFLEMLTHEFKTSLAVLKMALGSSEMGTKEGAHANRAIDSMNDVIERCSQVQALSDNQVAIEFDEIDLVALLEEVALSSRASERIQLTFEPTTTLSVKVRSDEKLLKVILSNLVDNALKYSKPISLVKVSLEVASQEFFITVSNEIGSAGVPDPKRVFTKYYRSAKAHRQVGSGLGLYLTLQFATMLGMKLNYIPNAETVEFQLCLKRSI